MFKNNCSMVVSFLHELIDVKSTPQGVSELLLNRLRIITKINEFEDLVYFNAFSDTFFASR